MEADEPGEDPRREHGTLLHREWHEGSMNAPGIREDLLKIIGHLGAAETQSLPSDDQIIMNHVRAALEAARAAYSELVQHLEPAQ